uniref:Uncharacterized protein n=1 Tax=Lepeophtheirus salmonis TaxID=72036 RepID=A0A0K2TBE5_LEPSM
MHCKLSSLRAQFAPR